jgi:hypothetical protein
MYTKQQPKHVAALWNSADIFWLKNLHFNSLSRQSGMSNITIKSTSKKPVHGPHILRRKGHKKNNSTAEIKH